MTYTFSYWNYSKNRFGLRAEGNGTVNFHESEMTYAKELNIEIFLYSSKISLVDNIIKELTKEVREKF
jgi:hypothetical protein